MSFARPYPSPALLRAFVIAILGVCCGSLYAAAPAISGTVRSTTGASLPSMVVAAYNQGGTVIGTATTDSSGAYKFASLSAGQYRLLVWDNAATYATTFAGRADSYDTTPWTQFNGSSSVTVDFQMPIGGFIAGHARNGSSAAPGVTIAVYNAGSGTRRGFDTTDAQGAYSIIVPPGQYKLVAYDDRQTFGPTFFPNALSFVDSTAVSIAASQHVTADFSLAAAARINGTVTTVAAAPLASMTLFAYTAAGNFVRSTTSDANGAYSLWLAAGAYRIVVADPLGTYPTTYVPDAPSFAASTPLSVDAGQTMPLNITIREGGMVRGQTTDSSGFAVVPQMTVVAYNTDGSQRQQITSNFAGNYQIVLPPGSYKIGAFDGASVFATQFYNVQPDFVRASPVVVQAAQTMPSVDFRLVRAGHFSGNVTDAQTSAPIRGATVAAYDASGVFITSTASNASGQFSIGVAPGTYRLMAWDDGHVYANTFDGGSNFEAILPRTVSSDASLSVAFVMSRGFAISGKSVTTAQTPISGISVEALDLSGNHVGTSVTASDGSFLITLTPGTYKLFLHDEAGRYPDMFYGGATTLSGAAVVVIESSSAPPPLTIVLTQPVSRRRAARH